MYIYGITLYLTMKLKFNLITTSIKEQNIKLFFIVCTVDRIYVIFLDIQIYD